MPIKLLTVQRRAFAEMKLCRAINKRKNRKLLSRLGRSESGVSAVEFALLLPVIMSMGMGGIEIASMFVANLQVNALALSVADNASRMEQTTNTTVTPTVTENDLNSIMKGAMLEGSGINIQTFGKVIVSSLERDPATGKQYIHWQRCGGSLTASSAYGNATTNNGLNGAVLTGMGSGATQVTAAAGSAVMFVEVTYRYNGVFGTIFTQPFNMKSEGAYLIRDIRNLGTAGSNPITGTSTGWTCP